MSLLSRLNSQTLSTDERLPFEFVAVERDAKVGGTVSRHGLSDVIMVDVIHDGCDIPAEYLAAPEAVRHVTSDFMNERDWGAELMAACLASALHLPGYYRVNTARVLLDFGRFPGITPPRADFMHRYAINYPFSETLSFEQKRSLLANVYDKISAGMDQAIEGKLLKIAIHTYDTHNQSGSLRPPVSLLTRSQGYTEDFGLPPGVFDPLFPDQLAEVTANRVLRSRISLTLEEAGIHVAENYPYSLPEGSVEVRARVWAFFAELRKRFDADPENSCEARLQQAAQDRVWDMLMDTNLRSTQSEALRSYLHMFRHAPPGTRDLFEAARVEYERIAAFLETQRDDMVGTSNPNEQSALLIEVRKDLVFEWARGVPIRPRLPMAQKIARTIAGAIRTYLSSDLARWRTASDLMAGS